MKPSTSGFPPGTRLLLSRMAGTMRSVARSAPDAALASARLELNRRPAPSWARGSLLLFARDLGKLAATYSGELLADRVTRLLMLWHIRGLAVEDLERVAFVVWVRLTGPCSPVRRS